MQNPSTAARLATALADRYRIERELGAGGMATVYLAHDLKHQRDVAIKVLHPDLAAALGGERFLTEIRTTARLQHPHILPLLDSGEADGLLYYVMPLITGETLRARLEREKQLPVEIALGIAREVADALGYAHELGVIHRDIKPENILLQGGHAMVADFGIALAVQSAGGQRMTQTGLSLGTPQYMSPEQAMGERSVDARSDLYALGAVTYEMLIGEAPFTGPTVQSIVARVLQEEPRQLVTQRRAVPEYVEFAVLRALEKLPADRWSTAQEFADALRGGSAATQARTTAGVRYGAPATMGWRARVRDPLTIALAVVAVLGVAYSVRSLSAPAVAPAEVVRFKIPASGSGSANALGYSTIDISRDGQQVLYLGEGENRRQQILVRRIDELEARALPGTEDAASPIFSPDGKAVAFIRSNQLYRVNVDGGVPQLIGTAPGTFNGMSWSSDGYLITSGNSALYRVPAAGGVATEFRAANRAEGELYVGAPVVLDEYGVVVYTSWKGASIALAKLAIASLATGETVSLELNGSQAMGILDGMFVYVTPTGALMAVPIDMEKRRVLGTPEQLLQGVFVDVGSGLSRAVISRNGTLFYQGGSQQSQLVRVSERGVIEGLLDAVREYGFPRVSPDGRSFAIAEGTAERKDVWIYDLASKTPTRLTTEGVINERPEWTPDGKRVLFRSDRAGFRTGLWWRPVDLSAPESPLLVSPRLDVFEGVMSPDSKYLALQVDTAGADVLYRAQQGDTTLKPISANARAVESMPRISPDGNWVAFTTDESGTSEVVVQPFPGPGGRVPVSSGGGLEPVWTRDGQAIVYRGRGKVMRARVSTGASFAVTARDTLFRDSFVFASNPHANYDVMPNGKEFLFLQSSAGADMVVVSNWGAVLRERMAGRP